MEDPFIATKPKGECSITLGPCGEILSWDIYPESAEVIVVTRRALESLLRRAQKA